MGEADEVGEAPGAGETAGDLVVIRTPSEATSRPGSRTDGTTRTWSRFVRLERPDHDQPRTDGTARTWSRFVRLERPDHDQPPNRPDLVALRTPPRAGS